MREVQSCSGRRTTKPGGDGGGKSLHDWTTDLRAEFEKLSQEFPAGAPREIAIREKVIANIKTTDPNIRGVVDGVQNKAIDHEEGTVDYLVTEFVSQALRS